MKSIRWRVDTIEFIVWKIISSKSAEQLSIRAQNGYVIVWRTRQKLERNGRLGILESMKILTEFSLQQCSDDVEGQGINLLCEKEQTFLEPPEQEK